MQLSFSVQAAVDGRALDARLVALLDALRAQGSVAAAARAIGASYRFAWDRLRSAESQYGAALVHMERGRGAHLTDFAARLLDAHARASADTAPALARICRDFEAGLPAAAASPPPRVRLAASHDLALIALKDHCARTAPALELDIQFRGSLEALDALARGRCDFAGFHVGPQAHDDATMRRRLSPRMHRLIVLGERTQGLMLAAGNPKRIGGIGDLARRGVRFVNRQPGSGTRILFDRLLAASGRKPQDIRGYDAEEFTHLAVAATVASGHADAGFGIEAAAARHGLSFLPLSTETYYLAAKRAVLPQDHARRLLQHMRSPEVHRRLSRLAGYRIDACGTLTDVEAAFTTPRD